ncbi:MAG: hypothetical protein V1834_03400 [Candidatus Micrarchaeota archaeon]
MRPMRPIRDIHRLITEGHVTVEHVQEVRTLLFDERGEPKKHEIPRKQLQPEALVAAVRAGFVKQTVRRAGKHNGPKRMRPDTGEKRVPLLVYSVHPPFVQAVKEFVDGKK